MFTTVSITVRDVLTLDPLRRARPRVVAGAAGLERSVRWVHVAELPDIAHLLEGGELLLTTGLAIAGDPSLQRTYVAQLAGAGAAGIVVELGRTFDAVPQEMACAAEELDLPLVALEHEARFVEVTEVVHREILSRQYALLDRVERVSRELTEQILEGADVGQLITHLAGVFGGVVVFEDAGRHVLAASGPAGADATVSTWEEHTGSGHVSTTRGEVLRSTGRTGCTWVDVWVRHDRWGRLHVFDAAPGVPDVSELLVDRAGTAIALSVLAGKDAAHLAERARSSLVGELAAGRHGSGTAFVRRAKSLGADLDAGRLVVVALEVAPGSAAPEVGDSERLEALRALSDRLQAAFVEHGCSSLTGLSGDRAVAIVAVPGTRPVAVVVEHVVGTALRRSFLPAGLRAVAGASDEVPADALHRAIGEATVAAAFGRHARGGRRVHHYADLGTYQLLLRLAEGPELARFVDTELRVLLERDSPARPRLLPTLRSYLRHAGRKAEAARELGIQRRTLYQRMERIQALLGRDVDDQATRTRLTLAIQGLDFLRERAQPAGEPR